MTVERAADPAQETPESEAETVWQAALDLLRTSVDPRTYDLRFAGSRALDWDRATNHWTIGLRDEISIGWVANGLSRKVTEAVSRLTPDRSPPELEFVASPAPGDARPPEAERDPRRHTDRVDSASGHLGGRNGPVRNDGSARSRRTLQKRRRDFGPRQYYCRILLAFRERALRRLKGPKLAVFLSVALRSDKEHVATMSLEQIMVETGYERAAVCSALAELCSPRLRLLEKLPRSGRTPGRYRVLGYIYYGKKRTPALYELETEPSS